MYFYFNIALCFSCTIVLLDFVWNQTCIEYKYNIKTNKHKYCRQYTTFAVVLSYDNIILSVYIFLVSFRKHQLNWRIINDLPIQSFCVRNACYMLKYITTPNMYLERKTSAPNRVIRTAKLLKIIAADEARSCVPFAWIQGDSKTHRPKYFSFNNEILKTLNFLSTPIYII